MSASIARAEVLRRDSGMPAQVTNQGSRSHGTHKQTQNYVLTIDRTIVDRTMIIFQPKSIRLRLLDHDCRWWPSIIG